MTRLPEWLCRTRGAMLALFAVLFLAGPVLDSLLCAADGVAPGPATAAVAAVAVSPGVHRQAADDGPGICQHGHAHAVMGVVNLQPPCAAPYVRDAVIVRPVSSRLPPSIAGPGLDRPPRA